MGQNTFRVFKPSRRRMKQIQEHHRRKRDREAATPNRALMAERERNQAKLDAWEKELDARRHKIARKSRAKPDARSL